MAVLAQHFASHRHAQNAWRRAALHGAVRRRARARQGALERRYRRHYYIADMMKITTLLI